MSARKLAAQLRAAGINVKKVVADPAFGPEFSGEDDEIEITDLVSVQVGSGYVVVNAWTSAAMDEMAHGPTRKPANVAAIVADIRRFLGMVAA